MATSVSPDGVSLLDLVARSQRLGSRFGSATGALPVEILERGGDATAEAYVVGLRTAGALTHVDLVLDHGLAGAATLAAFDAEWLELAEGQIVPVRIDRWNHLE